MANWKSKSWDSESRSVMSSSGVGGPALTLNDSDLSSAQPQAEAQRLQQEKVNRGYPGRDEAIDRLDESNESISETRGEGMSEITSPLPLAFDWRVLGAVTPVKDQGQCGSCWAFSTVWNIEGNNFVRNKLRKGSIAVLSEQEIVDCDVGGTDQGCNGGLMSSAMDFLVKSKHGLELASDYPAYSAEQNDKCLIDKAKEVKGRWVFLESWLPIKSDEDAMARALMQHGPLAVGVNWNWLQFYWFGIIDLPSFFCGNTENYLDHGVTITGFGHGPTVFGNDMMYWEVKNSWSDSWGMAGFFRVRRGTSVCGINAQVQTAVVAKTKTAEVDEEATGIASVAVAIPNAKSQTDADEAVGVVYV